VSEFQSALHDAIEALRRLLNAIPRDAGTYKARPKQPKRARAIARLVRSVSTVTEATQIAAQGLLAMPGFGHNLAWGEG
jgi:hypothetical protein